MRKYKVTFLVAMVLAAFITLGSFAVLGGRAVSLPGGSAAGAMVWGYWRTRDWKFGVLCMMGGMVTHLLIALVLGY